MKTLTEMKALLTHAASRVGMGSGSMILNLHIENAGCVDEYLYDSRTGVQIEIGEEEVRTLKGYPMMPAYDIGVAFPDPDTGGEVLSAGTTRNWQEAVKQFLSLVSGQHIKVAVDRIDEEAWNDYYNILGEEA